MKKIFLLAAGAMMLASCAFNFSKGVKCIGYTEEGADFSEERMVGVFDEFKADGPFNVYFCQSDTYKVVIDGKEEFVAKTIAEVNDEELTIKLEPGTYKDLVLKVTVYAPEIEKAATYSSGNLIDKEGHTSQEEISYKSAGSGDIILANVSAEDLDIITSGSGDIYVDGARCEDLEVKTSGSGDATLQNVEAGGSFEFTSAGSGNLKTDNIQVKGDINAKSSGSGNIRLNGSCRDINVKCSGSGSVTGNLEYRHLSSSMSGSGKINL